MANSNRATFNRPDTLFGICEAIGQDFGINPLWLRLAIVPAIFFAPAGTILAYLGAGLVVLASRLIFPIKSAAVDAPVVVAAPPIIQAVPAVARAAEAAPMALAA